jgi:DNA-binding transcriptional LysR family regulator
LLSKLEQAETSVREASAAPSGVLRVSAPVPFGQAYLAPLVAPLLERYPALKVELLLKDAVTDMVAEGIDLVVRIGTLRDSRLVARRLCTNRRVLVASPSYLKRRGIPQQPADLGQHACLTPTYLAPGHWRLHGPEGPLDVAICSAFSSNNIEVLIAAAEQGLGISVGPTQSVAEALLEGRLVRVLTGFELYRTAIHALFPSNRQLPSKVRAAVDFLSEQFGDPPAWDVKLGAEVAGF